jgi:hypothetical protein
MKQTRQAVHAIEKSIYLDVYGFATFLVKDHKANENSAAIEA